MITQRELLASEQVVAAYRAGRRDFRNIMVLYANFCYEVFSDADFSGAILMSARFENTALNRTNFTGADLGWATFDHVPASGATFARANLTKAQFITCYCDDADFTGADLKWATFDQTYTETAVFATETAATQFLPTL